MHGSIFSTCCFFLLVAIIMYPFLQSPHVHILELIRLSYQTYGFIKDDVIDSMRNRARLTVGHVRQTQ